MSALSKLSLLEPLNDDQSEPGIEEHFASTKQSEIGPRDKSISVETGHGCLGEMEEDVKGAKGGD